ncbi:MAG: hypothetical protein EAZ43_07850 [Betaproteobacteria bacterium]|nr:MAG: hypothetical protein EAZ43_07850 [Betaproteobacteria bacterium]
MKVSTADATAPVDISVGYKQTDFAIVPVAVQTQLGGVEKVWGDHKVSGGRDTLCSQIRNQIRVRKLGDKPEVAEEEARNLAAVCDEKRDAMSVYGRFDGSTSASGNERKAGLTAGRVFSTGVAAQNLTAAATSEATTACVKAVSATWDDKVTAEQKQKQLSELCVTNQ